MHVRPSKQPLLPQSNLISNQVYNFDIKKQQGRKTAEQEVTTACQHQRSCSAPPGRSVSPQGQPGSGCAGVTALLPHGEGLLQSFSLLSTGMRSVPCSKAPGAEPLGDPLVPLLHRSQPRGMKNNWAGRKPIFRSDQIHHQVKPTNMG